MTAGKKAMLIMKKALVPDLVLDEKTYLACVLRYDAKQECLYLVLENDLLSAISLDAIYECRIQNSEKDIWCTGRIKERFRNEHGQILKLEIENGFYKINLKSVDKQ